ncbi:hypothetical protein [Actinomadura flavalba]|uniref:hypothetical protein n=1 Tax=Actinomadura flavalba TaxID=1120938 RepID=UPI000367B251|nr:hypothetical protein [Actinomadura flavalba]
MTGRFRVPYGRGCALAAGGLAAVLTVAGGTAAEPRDRVRRTDDADAQRLLRAAADAARDLRYEGRRFLTTWGNGPTTAHVAVVHEPGVGTGYASARTPDLASEPIAATFDLLDGNYTLVRAPGTTLLGRRVHVVEAYRPHGGVAGRFYLDAATGLLLRRELLDAAGGPVCTSGFSSIRVGTAGTVPPSARVETPWPGRLDAAARARLRDGGWPVREALPGRLRLYDARRAADGTVHLGYSDGLATVSVFVQRGELDARELAGWRRSGGDGRPVFRRDGLHRWAVTGGGGYVVTVVTEAPESTAAGVAALLPPRGEALPARLARGARRLGSWVNPFD